MKTYGSLIGEEAWIAGKYLGDLYDAEKSIAPGWIAISSQPGNLKTGWQSDPMQRSDTPHEIAHAVYIPGSVDAATISAIITDEMAIGMINNKTTAVRVIPVPGKAAGEFVSFGGLFGESAIAPVRNAGQSARFVGFVGKIPAPIHSLRN